MSTLWCKTCDTMKALEEFELLKDGINRSSLCRECNRSSVRKSRALAKEKQAEEMKRFEDLVGQNRSCPDLVELIGHHMIRFKGVGGYVRFWHEQLNIAADARPGSKLVLDSLNQIAKLIYTATDKGMTGRDVKRMTTEEIEQELETRLATKFPKVLEIESDENAA